jgi:predicted TIM-barrel fold metal-dependent hydrolase
MMGIFDAHIHIRNGEPDPHGLIKRMDSCNISGAVLISIPPDEASFRDRINNLFEWTEGNKTLFPFLWLDPLDEDSTNQVNSAVDAGVMGFKVICDRFYPGDDRCIRLCEKIASLDKPIIFHSGILWDGKPSSEYCRPVNFESLLLVEDLRFSLAHIGWPWIDEMVAVYGKFLNYRSKYPNSRTEMFIDMTPGTPFNYRSEAISKLFGTGYDVGGHLLFGSDCDANDYNSGWVLKWLGTDEHIYDELGIDLETKENIYTNNFEDFIFGGHDRPLMGQKPAVL